MRLPPSPHLLLLPLIILLSSAIAQPLGHDDDHRHHPGPWARGGPVDDAHVERRAAAGLRDDDDVWKMILIYRRVLSTVSMALAAYSDGDVPERMAANWFLGRPSSEWSAEGQEIWARMYERGLRRDWLRADDPGYTADGAHRFAPAPAGAAGAGGDVVVGREEVLAEFERIGLPPRDGGRTLLELGYYTAREERQAEANKRKSDWLFSNPAPPLY